MPLHKAIFTCMNFDFLLDKLSFIGRFKSICSARYDGRENVNYIKKTPTKLMSLKVLVNYFGNTHDTCRHMKRK